MNSSGNGSMTPVGLGSLMDPAQDSGLTDSLGRAAQTLAEKASSAPDGGEAKDYAAGALSLVTALMAIVAPKVQNPPGGSGGGAGKPAAQQTGP